MNHGCNDANGGVVLLLVVNQIQITFITLFIISADSDSLIKKIKRFTWFWLTLSKHKELFVNKTGNEAGVLWQIKFWTRSQVYQTGAVMDWYGGRINLLFIWMASELRLKLSSHRAPEPTPSHKYEGRRTCEICCGGNNKSCNWRE